MATDFRCCPPFNFLIHILLKRVLILLFLFVVFLLPGTQAADIAIKRDTSALDLRRLSETKIESYREQKAFQYTRVSGGNTLAILIQEWLYRMFGKLLRAAGNSFNPELILMVLIALTVIAIVLKANNINPVALFRRRKQLLHPDAVVTDENMAAMNFDALINDCENQGNLRLAVRYSYLQTLALLALAEKVKLREQKTNREYVNELTDLSTRQMFAVLVTGFEYVWYGEFSPDRLQYQSLRSAFITFQKTLQP